MIVLLYSYCGVSFLTLTPVLTTVTFFHVLQKMILCPLDASHTHLGHLWDRFTRSRGWSAVAVRPQAGSPGVSISKSKHLQSPINVASGGSSVCEAWTEGWGVGIKRRNRHLIYGGGKRVRKGPGGMSYMRKIQEPDGCQVSSRYWSSLRRWTIGEQVSSVLCRGHWVVELQRSSIAQDWTGWDVFVGRVVLLRLLGLRSCVESIWNKRSRDRVLGALTRWRWAEDSRSETWGNKQKQGKVVWLKQIEHVKGRIESHNIKKTQKVR